MQVCCPFDISHIVDSTKLLRHIQKCKSGNRPNFRQCPFNQVHWVHFDHIERHVKGNSAIIQSAHTVTDILLLLRSQGNPPRYLIERMKK